MARKVLCLMDNQTTTAGNCDGNIIPFSSESCNAQSCVEDDVTPVDASHDIRETITEIAAEEEEECEDDSEEEDDDEDEESSAPPGGTSPVVPPSWITDLLVGYLPYTEKTLVLLNFYHPNKHG